jgi:hypothetical protein
MKRGLQRPRAAHCGDAAVIIDEAAQASWAGKRACCEARIKPTAKQLPSTVAMSVRTLVEMVSNMVWASLPVRHKLALSTAGRDVGAQARRWRISNSMCGGPREGFHNTHAVHNAQWQPAITAALQE